MQTLKSNPGAFLKKNRYTLLALLVVACVAAWMLQERYLSMILDYICIYTIAVTGLVPVDPQAGSVLKTADSQSQQFTALTALLEELENSGITEQVSSIRFESAYLILRYLDRFDVKMKLHADFNYNIRLTQAIQLQIESEYTPQAAGSIDLTQEYGAVYSPAPSQDIS